MVAYALIFMPSFTRRLPWQKTEKIIWINKQNKSILILCGQTRFAGSFDLLCTYKYGTSIHTMRRWEKCRGKKISPRFKDDYLTCFFFYFSIFPFLSNGFVSVLELVGLRLSASNPLFQRMTLFAKSWLNILLYLKKYLTLIYFFAHEQTPKLKKWREFG